VKKFVFGFILAAFIFSSYQVVASEKNQSVTISYNVNDIKIDHVSKMPQEESLNPFIYNGSTFVPLRYIAENLDKEVTWDDKTKTIHIGTKELELDEEVEDAIRKIYTTFRNEDIKGYVDLFHSDYENKEHMEERLEVYFKNYDVHATLDEVEVIYKDNQSFVLRMVETVRETSGAQFGDFIGESITILKKEDNQWKTYEITPINIEPIDLE
jgi:hypothetical protein